MTFGSVGCFFLLTCEFQNQSTGQDQGQPWKVIPLILSLYPEAYGYSGYNFKAMDTGDAGPCMSILNCGINMTMTRAPASSHAQIGMQGHWKTYHQQVSLRGHLKGYHREFAFSPCQTVLFSLIVTRKRPLTKFSGSLFSLTMCPRIHSYITFPR